jgi:hypothetical protein
MGVWQSYDPTSRSRDISRLEGLVLFAALRSSKLIQVLVQLIHMLALLLQLLPKTLDLVHLELLNVHTLMRSLALGEWVFLRHEASGLR